MLHEDLPFICNRVEELLAMIPFFADQKARGEDPQPLSHEEII